MTEQNLQNDQLNRRRFIQAGTALLASLVTAKAARSGHNPIRVGVIGCGSRGGNALMRYLMENPDARVVAVCDVYRQALLSAQRKVGPDTTATSDYHDVLNNPDIDAVVVATPDRHHVPMTIDALAAGKDVYVEKPLTYSLEESARILKATESSDRIVQVGAQQRSMPQFRQARKLVQDGVIGPVRIVRMWWNRNATPYQKPTYKIVPEDVDWNAFLGSAPYRPFDPFTMERWRYFWDFGGGAMTDLMIHWLDGAAWILGLGLPDQISTIGDHFATEGIYEIPDSVQCLMHYEKEGLQAHMCSSYVSSHEQTGLELRGEKATIYLDRSRFELHPEPKWKLKPQEFILDPSIKRGSGADGKDKDGKPGSYLHMANWLDCIRTRRQPVSSVASCIPAVEAIHWANRSLREKRMINLS